MHWNLSEIFIGILLVLAGYALGLSSAGRKTRVTRSPNLPISDTDIAAQLRAGHKIEAIKLYRQRTGCGLKEAKTAIEAMHTAPD